MKNRKTQRDILPTAVRERHKPIKENAFSVTVSQSGGGDFTDIQSAVDAVKKIGGGTIYIKSGTYTVTANIYLGSQMTLIGEDPETTIVDFNNTMAHFHSGSRLAYVWNLHIKNLKIVNCKDSTNGAIDFNYTWWSSVENCHFEKNWNATEAFGVDIRPTLSWLTRISRCRSTNSGWLVYGYTLAGLNSYLRMENCESINSYKGLIEVPGNSGSIYNNYVEGSKGNAIDLSVDATEARVVGNYIVDNDLIGINNNSPRVIVADNYISSSSSGTHSIYFGEHADYGNIVNNTISSITDGYSGIYLYNGADGTVIKNNSFQGGGGTTAINVSHANCDQTVILANIFNTVTDVSDSGTNTIEEHNGSL